MRKSIGTVAIVLLLFTTGCVGGIGPLDGGESSNESDTGDSVGSGDAPERQTAQEAAVNQTAGGNVTIVVRYVERGTAYHYIDWNDEVVYTEVEGPRAARYERSFEESELVGYYRNYAPDWYEHDV